MGNVDNTGIRRVIDAARFSMIGLRAAWKNEAAFRQECVLGVILIPLAFWLGRSAVERSLLIGSCLIVLITELLNSAIEAVVDRVGTERNELSGRAKDMASAAVFVSVCLVGVVWALIAFARFG